MTTAVKPTMITMDMVSNRTVPVREVVPTLHETDEQIVDRLRIRFNILDDMTRAVKKGDVRAMIVSGPPGVGKSHGVENVLSRHDVFATIAQDDALKKYEIAKGNISALGLYQMLWSFKDKRSIIVFDDCDSVLFDDIALNLLKAALDTGRKRTISWHTESRILKEAGIPNSFDFEGGCIFITNVKFDHVKSKKLKDHLEALESRCHYLDLTIDTEREKMLRIKQIVSDGMLDKYDFVDNEADEVVNYIDTHRKRMRELSLRMVLKVADLRKSMPSSWESVASVTCMRPHR
jgi:hypothetical protein